MCTGYTQVLVDDGRREQTFRWQELLLVLRPVSVYAVLDRDEYLVNLAKANGLKQGTFYEIEFVANIDDN